MDDIVARYTLKFNDLASKGLLRAATAAKAFSIAGTAALAGIGFLTAGVIALTKDSFALAGQWAEYLDSLDETAAKAGLSATYTRDLGMALADMGVEREAAEKGFIKFNQNLGKFRSSGVPKALSQISGNFGYLTDKTLSTEQALQKTLETIAAIPDSAKRAAALGTVFGKAGVAMGAAVGDIAALNAGMKIYNDILGTVGAKQLKDASDYSSALLQAGAAWTAIKLAIGQQAAPLFIPLIQDFVKFLVANKDKITAGFADSFSQLGAAMKQVDWGAVMSSMVKLVGYIPTLVTAFSWVVDNIGTLALAFGGIKIASFLGNVGLLVPLLSRMGAALKIVATAATYLGPLVLNLGKFFLGGLGGALMRVGPLALTAGRTILMAMGPVGWIITGIVAAGVLLYQNWDTVKGAAMSLWATMGAAWSGIDKATGGFLGKLVGYASKIISMVFAPIKAAVQLFSGDWAGAFNTMIAPVNWLIQKLNMLLALAARLTGLKLPSIPTVGQLGATNARAASAASGRQSVYVNVKLDGEVKGAKMQAPSVRTSQAPRGRGGNHPAGGRR